MTAGNSTQLANDTLPPSQAPPESASKPSESHDKTKSTPYQPKQYNPLAANYERIKRLPPTHVETASLRSAVAPYVAGARVLDLACGTGYYSRQLLQWGAVSVVGVDISEGMVAVAQGSIPPDLDSKGQLRFLVGDARTLGLVDSGGYDLVTAAWLLNYARDANDMRAMFVGIAANLKPGGVFVGITVRPVPAEEMDAHKKYNDSIREKKLASWGLDVCYADRLEGGGWSVDLSTLGKDGKDGVRFTTFHLPKEVYESAAREVGMKGVFEWREVRLEGAERENAVREAGEEFFREYFEDVGPHFGVLVVKKKE